MSAEGGNAGVKKPIDLRLISDADLKREADKIREAKKLARERDTLTKSSQASTTPTGSSKANAETKKLQRELSKKIKDIEKKQKELDKKVQNIVEKGGDFINNPKGSVQAEIFSLAAKAGPLGLVVAMGPQLIDKILDEFGPGGVFDVRIKEQNEVKTIGSLDYLLDIQNGTVLFSESAFLTDEPPSVVRTDKLVAGQMRFYQFNAGDYVGIEGV